MQRDKEGHEVDQGIFLAHVLADARIGTHLCHAMLLPRPETAELLGEVRRRRPPRSRRRDASSSRARPRSSPEQSALTSTPRTTRRSMLTEIAVDLAILDPADRDRGAARRRTCEHPKYRGRRMLGSGINLTHLYHGKIPFIWFLQRDLGIRAQDSCAASRARDVPPDDVHGHTASKSRGSPWSTASPSAATARFC